MRDFLAMSAAFYPSHGDVLKQNRRIEGLTPSVSDLVITVRVLDLNWIDGAWPWRSIIDDGAVWEFRLRLGNSSANSCHVPIIDQ